MPKQEKKPSEIGGFSAKYQHKNAKTSENERYGENGRFGTKCQHKNDNVNKSKKSVTATAGVDAGEKGWDAGGKGREGKGVEETGRER